MQNPFEYSDTNKRYHTLEYENRRRYGGRVVKVPLDAGFTCPNIDGMPGTGGPMHLLFLPGQRRACRSARHTPDGAVPGGDRSQPEQVA